MRAARRWIGDHAVWAATILVLLYLSAPVVYTFVFSFNNYKRSNLVWNSQGSPTLSHWASPCTPAGLCDALVTSVQVGLLATAIATVLGTLMAFALVRSHIRGRGLAEVLVLLPMATPDVVLGAGLLTLFVQGLHQVGFRLGMGAIVAAHVMMCLGFVVVVVRSRLEGLDPRLDEAAADLYASPVATFRHVTLPLAAPGIVGAALLSFAVSFDDVVVTTFVSGEAMTFPRYVYVTALRGIPAEANVIGISLMLAALALAGAMGLVSTRRRRRTA